MTRLITGLALAAALVAGGLFTTPAYADKADKKVPGVLRVIDEAKLFSGDAIKSAENLMRAVSFDHGLTLVIDTHPSLPAERKPELDRATDDAARNAVFEAWAKSLYVGDKAEGIYVLICKSPGAVVVLTDKETRNRGFSVENEHKLRDMIRTGLRDAASKPEAEKAAARDAVLKSAVTFVVTDLKGTQVTTHGDGSPVSASTVKKDEVKEKTGRSVGGWICLGLCVLLGVWLVIGLIRALTGGGGGAGGPGGGGGGFGSSLLGGLFGAMAGMWLYNSMFGHGGMFGGSDAYAGDAGTGGAEGDTGAGDLADDTGAGGYDGGDYGGGGGDWGGGGDFGGGDF